MSFRILFHESMMREGLYPQDDPVSENNGAGWPKNTWFQKRLGYIREQQRKKPVEPDVVYECGLGTIIIRQPNGRN